MRKLSDGQGPGSEEKVTQETNDKARAVATEWPGPAKGPARALLQPHSNPRSADTISSTIIISILQTSKNEAPRSQGTCTGYQGQQVAEPGVTSRRGWSQASPSL